MAAHWWYRFSRRGFVGPRFDGAIGKLRFLWQEMVVRRDIVLIAMPETVAPQSSVPAELRLDVVRDFTGVEPFADALDAEYFPGFAARFRAPFGWGETLTLLSSGARVVGFRWYQRGTAQGTRYYAGTLLPGDARILRGGIVPSGRRRGYNTALHVLLLHLLFEDGARRVFADVNKDNIPSVLSLTAAGYRPIRELTVLGPMLGGFIRWEP